MSRRLGGPQSRSGHFGEERNIVFFLAGLELLTSSPQSLYTDCDIPVGKTSSATNGVSKRALLPELRTTETFLLISVHSKLNYNKLKCLETFTKDMKW